MGLIFSMFRKAFALAALGCMAAAHAASNPYFDPEKAHHTPTGFRNNHVESVRQSLPNLVRWKWNAWLNGLPLPPQAPTPAVAADVQALAGYPRHGSPASHGPDTPMLTWIGHATVLVQAGGLNILTDPIFSERASPVQFAGPRRAQPPGVALADLPPIDVVVVSHNHFDHLDKASVVQLKALADQRSGTTVFLVPLGVKPLLQSWGIESVQELDWWDKTVVQGTEFHFTPTQHWSARSLHDAEETLWGAWSVFGPTLHWYFAGDTGYSQDFADTRRHFQERWPEPGTGFDLALIPIGAYEPRWFMQRQHVDPAQALQIHRDLGARRSIGIHWGTFPLTDEPLDQAPKDLQRARCEAGIAQQAFGTLAIGETVLLPPRLTPRQATMDPPAAAPDICN